MQQRVNLPDPARPLEKRRIAVALQGGGSHGAFTWGVLDRLLGEPSLEIVGISGTSAGAMNAGVLADGLRRGGASQAQLALHQYWKDVGHLPGYGTLWPLAPQRTWHLDHNPIYLWGDMLTRVWSLYHLCRHHGIAMAMPSSWRSRRTSVSKAAKTASMPKNARPAAVEVSTLCSMTLRCASACSIS
jgi:hypothetical protein